MNNTRNAEYSSPVSAGRWGVSDYSSTEYLFPLDIWFFLIMVLMVFKKWCSKM